jgi:hypothetical protein
MPWLVRSLRLTVFRARNAIDWHVPDWVEVVGAEPQSRLTQAGGVQIAVGPFGEGQLQLGHRQGVSPRADLHYLAAPDPSGAPELRTLGPFPEAIRPFGPIADALLRRSRGVSRIAFGVEYLEPVPNTDEGYRVLADRIDPHRFDLRDVQDFSYQINRRRPSNVISDLVLNRLSRWSLLSAQVLTIDVVHGQTVTQDFGTPAAFLSTDVNSDVTRQSPLPTTQLGALFAELQELTVELADRGDIP